MSQTSRSRVRYVRGTPSQVRRRYSFENVIQPLRQESLFGSFDFTDTTTTQPTPQEAASEQAGKVVHFTHRTSPDSWDNSNKDPHKAPGQRRWKERVVLAIDDANQPVGYWRTGLNVSSGFERRRLESGRTGLVTTIGGMIERGIKRAFLAQSHTFVWTPEYGALPAYKHTIPTLGALALGVYPKNRQGTIYPVTEDRRAKEIELPIYGYRHDHGQPTPVEGLFEPGVTTSQERWVTPNIGDSQRAMLTVAGLTELPPVESVTHN